MDKKSRYEREDADPPQGCHRDVKNRIPQTVMEMKTFFSKSFFSVLILSFLSIGHIPTYAMQATTVSGNVRDHYRFNRL